MQVTCYCRKKPLHILIENDNTHNFLDVDVDKKIGCRIDGISCLKVDVADGSKVSISSVVKGFTWSI